MKLPNGGRAVVDVAKLRDYCLNRLHPRGRHKARVFQAALGLTHADAEILREALLAAAHGTDVEPAQRDEHGQRFILDFVMTARVREATVRSCWIVRAGEDFPRLTSCWVL